MGYLTAYRIIRPITKIGSLVKGAIAGVIADSTVMAPNEERLSNLIQSFPKLRNGITEYLQAKPDDSEAEGRLKNALEGLIVGLVAEPFMRSLRLLKYARIRLPIVEVRTKRHYELEAVKLDNNGEYSGKLVAKELNAQINIGGAARAKQYSSNWQTADINIAIQKFAGDNPKITITESGKKIYTNQTTGIQIVEDLNGNYFRIYNPNLLGKRAYLDMDGKIPSNKLLENGKEIGRTQGEYNQITHFNIERK